MPADDCPIECSEYPHCGCGQEPRFSLAGAHKGRDDQFVVRDIHGHKVYRSWIDVEMRALVKLMNKLIGVSR